MNANAPPRPVDGEHLRVVEPEPDDIFTGDQLDGVTVPARAWHVRGLIPARTVTLLSGDGGVGKSTLALQLACATAAETPWLGQDPRPGRALYLSAEDDRDELHRRLDQIATFYGVGFEALAGLKAWSLADQDALLAIGAEGQAIETTALWERLGRVVDDWRPRLIVLDSSADFYGGNENHRAHVRGFVRLLRGLAIASDTAVLLLAHPSLTGLNSGSGTSGSTHWNNAVRSRLYFTAPDEGPGSPVRVLTVKKANYAQAGNELRLRYVAGAFASDDLGAAPGMELASAGERIDRQFLELLDAFAAQGRIVSDSTGRNYAPHLFAHDPRAAGTTRKGFESAMNRLFATGAIRIAEVGKGSHARRKIVRDDTA